MGVEGGGFEKYRLMTDREPRLFLFVLPPAVLTADHLTDSGAWACLHRTPLHLHSCLQDKRNKINRPELCALWAGDEVFGGLSLQPEGNKKILSAFRLKSQR